LGGELLRALRAREQNVDIWTAKATPSSSRSPCAMIAALMRSAGVAGIESGDEVSRAFLDLVAARCAERPLLLLLDDLQWADASTVRTLDHAMEHLEDRPLFFLALGRPELHDMFPALWKGRPLQEIRLRELPRKPAERLVQEALGARATPETIERIVRLSRGN